LQNIFSNEPPVYSKPAQSAPPVHTAANHVPPTPPKQLASQNSGYQVQPRPIQQVNPELIKLNSLKDTFRNKIAGLEQAELYKLSIQIQDSLKLNESLNQGQARLHGVLSQLDVEQSKLLEAIENLKLKKDELQNITKVIEETPDPTLETLITPQSPVHAQLLTLASEDHMIDDVIYYLAKALTTEKIDVASFLKVSLCIIVGINGRL
jgi:ESCRT-I complex subunit TSG101